MTDRDRPPVYHQAGGREQLTEAETRAYLEASGYAAEADRLIAESLRGPGFCYTADRHRCVVHTWRDGGYWRAADTTEAEEHIKSLPRGRRRW